MPITNAPQLLHEVCRRRHISAFALYRLDENGGNFFWRDGGLEHLVFNEASASHGIRLAFSIDIWKRNVRHAGNQWRKAAPLLRFRCGQRQRTHSPAVESAVKRNDVFAARVVSRQLERA